MRRLLSCGALGLALSACVTAPRSTPPTPAAPVAPAAPSAEPASVPALVAAIQQDASLSEHESDSATRSALAADADRDSQACLERDPQSAACLYARAVALGLTARVHPAQAGELLGSMLDNLARADAADPGYDEAGPARVRALVLTRAPGWPLGPGDPEAAVVAARRAVMLRPHYPPNLLALAEAMARAGDEVGARANYARAHDAALALPDSADRGEWLHQAELGLLRRADEGALRR